MHFPEAIAWFSLQIAVLVGLVATLQLALRRWLTPRWRCWLWGLVVLRLALPVSLSSGWSLFNLLPRPAPPTPAAPSTLTQSPPIPAFTPPAARVQAALREASAAASPLPLPAGMANPTPSPAPALESPALSSRRPVPTAWFSLPRMLAMLWAAGFLTVLGLTLAGARRLSRWVSGAQPCADPLPYQLLAETAARVKVHRLPEARELPGLSSPSLYGFLRPQVLLPPGLARRLSARQLRHVLLHELAHVKRHDIALNWVLALLQAVYWFHPLVWWALARLRAERELACDEIALQAAGADEAEDYGQTILQMLAAWSRPATSPAVVGILEDRRHLRHRLLHIAAFRPGRRTGLTVLLGLALVGAATLTDAQTPGTGTNAPAQPVPPSGTNLPPVVPLRYTNLLQQAEARDLHSGGNWANAPRGSNVFGGVHFEIDGLIQLASKTSEEAKRGFRPHLTLPAPTNTYGSVHLLAATAWSMENNRTVAEVIWRYADGTFKRTPLLYAGHVRDWRRRLFEDPHRVYSKLAKAAAIWSSPDADRAGTKHRMYRVTLANPEPTRKVAALQFQSAMNEASLMFLAVSLDPLPAGARPDPEPDLEPADPQWTRHLGVTVIDAASSNRVGGATVKSRVVTTPAAGRQSFDRTYTADGSGIADVLLPEKDVDSVSLTVSQKDYSETQYNQPVGTNALPPFLTVRLHGGIDIGGIILDAAGQPVANARVNVYRFWTGNDRPDSPGEQGGFSGRNVTTGPDGRWEASQVPAHALNRIGISVRHDEYVPAQIQAVDQDEAVEQALREKRHEIRLEAGLWVTGLVVNPDGQPVPNADVRVGKRYFAQTREAKAGADGRFRIGGQAPGETVVSATAQGYGGTAVKVTIAPDMPEVRLELTKGSRLRGRVLDPDGQPVAGAWVSAESDHSANRELQDELANFNTRTDAEGRWQWEAAPEGEIPFTFGKEGFARKSRVMLQAGEQEHVVTLNRPRSVVGTVTDEESGEPVAEFTLEPRGRWWQHEDARTFRAPDGRYEMSLDKEHYDKFQVTSPTHEPREVPIPPTERAVLTLDIRLKRSESFEGTVVDAAGRPVPGAHVVLNSPQEGGAQFRAGRLESYGPFPVVLSGPDGTFKLQPRIQPEGVVASTPEGFGFVPLDEFRQTHRVVLEPYGRIEGTYRGRVDPNGRARLNLTFISRAGKYLGIWGTETYQPQVESGGKFTIERVPPGSHQLVRMVPVAVNHWSHAPIQTVEVRPGETTVVEVDVQGVRITGRYTLPEGVDPRDLVFGGDLSTASPFKFRPGMSPEELQKLNKDPAFQAAMAKVRHHPVFVQSDGTFAAEDVPTGEYDLRIFALRTSSNQADQSTQMYFNRTLTVPADAVTGSTVDVGVFALEPAAAPKPTPP